MRQAPKLSFGCQIVYRRLVRRKPLCAAPRLVESILHLGSSVSQLYYARELVE